MELFDSSEAKKNVAGVLDKTTMEAVYTLADKGYFELLHGFVKEGKESKVCVARAGDTMIAVKIYTVEASNYQQMQDYLLGDPRFRGIKKNRRSIVYNWCSKEYKNLQKAQAAGINTPTPIAFEKNILLMEFLGDGYQPAPRLQEVTLENPETALDMLLDNAKTLWQQEKLVHADYSPYNVLVWNGQLYVIDFSQAVLTAHPRAEEWLRRDITNMTTHFERRYNIERDPDSIVTSIVAEGV